MSDSDAMADEFDTLARWTERAIDELGPDHAVPAGCRGSGVPAALAWMVEQLGLTDDTTLLDVGAGVGGAAEFAVEASGVAVTLVDPMPGACHAARRLFSRPVVVATGEGLPFGDNSFDAVWALGVLCTSADQPAVLRELRRVVAPGGRIGLLVFVATVDSLTEQPEGNDFPTRDGLERMLGDAGMHVVARAALADFPDPPSEWQDRVDGVDAFVARHHRHDRRWQTARDQEKVITRLFTHEQVAGVLLVLQPGT